MLPRVLIPSLVDSELLAYRQELLDEADFLATFPLQVGHDKAVRENQERQELVADEIKRRGLT